MGGRDHSVTCVLCGAEFGGLGGPDVCPCREKPVINELWTVECGGATYWVSAATEEEAVQLVKQQPDWERNAVRARRTAEEEKQRMRMKFDDGETCKLDNAFSLVRDRAIILCCSEWP